MPNQESATSVLPDNAATAKDEAVENQDPEAKFITRAKTPSSMSDSSMVAHPPSPPLTIFEDDQAVVNRSVVVGNHHHGVPRICSGWSFADENDLIAIEKFVPEPQTPAPANAEAQPRKNTTEDKQVDEFLAAACGFDLGAFNNRYRG
jgi:hypothetical protein